MSSTTASQEELKAHRVPLAWRDQCSAYVVTVYSCAVSPNLLLAGHDHIIPRLPLDTSRPPRWIPRYYAHSLLLPLNVCRKEKYYLPWECENERHAYEKCVLS
jgi:NADH-ubiquinone oxidoreductase B18 subunit (NDUFB7)